MPEPLSGLNNNHQSLLSTILQHLPNVHANPELANAIFAVIHKAHRTSDVERFIVPLLPSLTSLALTVPLNQLVPTAHLIVTLVSSIPPSSRAFKHTNAFVSQLVALTVRLLETRTPGPIQFCLPSFPLVNLAANTDNTDNNDDNTANDNNNHNEPDADHPSSSTPISNSNSNSNCDSHTPSSQSTNNSSTFPVDPLPLTPSTLHAALVLLALHIPSTYPLPCFFPPGANASASSPSSPTTQTFAATLTSVIRLWRGLNAHPRAALLNLASRHELISSRCGPSVATIATHILLRALDPVNTVPVSRPLRERIARVVTDVVPSSTEPSLLFQVIAAARTRSILPASVALPLALSNHGSVGHALRSVSRTAKLDLFSHMRTPPPISSGVLFRPRKRLRPNPSTEQSSPGQENIQIQPNQQNHHGDNNKRGELNQGELPQTSTAMMVVDENNPNIQNYSTMTVSQSNRLKHSRSPASILRKYVAESQIAEGAQQTSSSIRLLANAVSISADALNALMNVHAVALPSLSIRRGRMEWPGIAASLSNVVMGCVKRFSSSPIHALWPSILSLGQGILRLYAALRAIGDSGGTHIFNASFVLRDALLSIVPLAFQALENSTEGFPVESFASLLQYIGDAALESPGFLGERTEFSQCILKIPQYAIALPENLQAGQHAVLIKASFHVKFALINGVQTEEKSSIFGTPGAPKKLSTLIKYYLNDFPALSAAALGALADELCLSLGCCQSHVPRYNWDRIQVKSIRPLIDIAPWTPALDAVVHTSLCANINSDISSGVVRCMTSMAVHCPSDRRSVFANVLIDLLWSVRHRRILDMVLSSLSYLLECESSGKFEHADDEIDVDEDDSDEAESHFVIANLVLSRLQSCVDQISEALSNNTIPSDINLRAVSYHLLLNFDETFAPRISALVCPTLLQLYATELSSSNEMVESGQKGRTLSETLSSTPQNMDLWSDLFATAMMLMQRMDPNRAMRTGLIFGGGSDIAIIERGVFNMSLSASQAISNMFFSRISDWGHLLLNRMLNDESFTAAISALNVESSGRGFWNRFPRYVVTPLLLRNDIASLNSLACKLETTTKQIVDKTVADSIAMMLMNSESDNQHFNVVSRIVERPVNDLMASKAGKVVQRLVMEFGGAREQDAKAALVRFAQINKSNITQNSNNSERLETEESLSGSLVVSHFLLVMDAVNRRLFQSKATENEQLRHLRMLKSILMLAKNHIHAFIPKILATLKLALDLFSNNRLVCEETVQVWSCFLQMLGSERILVHVTSILTIISPFLNQLGGTLCGTLASLIQKSEMHSYNERSLVILLLRMSNHQLLARTADVLENPKPTQTGNRAQRNSSEQSALHMSVPAIEQLCRDVGKIIAQHGNGVIEVMAARYMLQVLRTNRAKVDEVARSEFFESQNSGGSGNGTCLAKLQTLLVEQLSITRNCQCLRMIMQCIGEVGAIEPVIVSQASNGGSSNLNEQRSSPAQQQMPSSIHALVALLLDDFLVPTLLAQGEIRSASTSRINRIGLVIQELIRVCGCKRNTASRASKSKNVRRREDSSVQWDMVLVGETNEENAIFFWENLLPETRDVITPYLAEPFDVQHYKTVFGANSAGNEDLACQPVWSKIKVVVTVGPVANAQEWRRQTAVQLVDFIGKQGEFGEVLQSLRPILRYEDPVTAFIFPIVFMTALDLTTEKKSDRLKNFLIDEVAQVLKEAGAPKIMFDLFDTLREWREIRCSHKASSYANKYCQGNSTSLISRRKASIPKFKELAKREDPLSSFVDLYENVSSSISLLVQAQCAFRTRSYARAILLAENHLRMSRRTDQLRIWPAALEEVLGTIATDANDSDDAEAVRILQKCFAELEDADSLRGLAALRSSSTLGEQVIDTEVSGRFHEALITYERAIAKSPRSVQFHRGFLRCLMTLGHWETMLSHAEGLVHSAGLNEMELRRMAEANGIEAAWRLGRWESIQSFDHVPIDDIVQSAQDVEPINSWDNDFAISFGSVLHALHDKDRDALRIAADGARENLLIPIIRAASEGYNRTYPMIVRLHAVADVESTMEELLFRESSKETNGNAAGRNRPCVMPDVSQRLPKLISMPGRTLMTASSLKFREPLLSVKRVCFEQLEMFDESARVSLDLAIIAKDGDNLRSAAATAFRGLSMNSHNEEVKHALMMETAQIQRLQGDASGALLIVKEEINRLKKLVAFHKNRQGNEEVSRKLNNRLTSAFVVAGSWIAHSRSEPSEVVLEEYFQPARFIGADHEEPFYALGKHYDLLLQASLNADEDLTVNDTQSQGRSARRSATPVETHAPEHSSKYVPLVIKAYARALCNGHSRLFEALPRMLTVWFDYYTGLDGSDGYKGMCVEGQVQDVMKLSVQSIPVYMWMTAIPQLMSRILHSRKCVRNELAFILARTICYFPDQTYWTIVPATQLRHSAQRKSTITDILNQAITLMRKDRRGEFKADVKHRFRDRMYNWLLVMTCFVEICEAPGSKDRRGRMDNCSKEFKELKSQLRASGLTNPMIPTLRTLTARLPLQRDPDAVPDHTIAHRHQPFDSDTVRIVGIDDYVLVMSSLMCPRRIALLGSDGQGYRYLAKMEDKGDMRRDSRVVEFLTVLNELLSRQRRQLGGNISSSSLSSSSSSPSSLSPSSCRGKSGGGGGGSSGASSPLNLKTYAVLPLTEETGMIEWVNDLCPFRTLVGHEHARLEKPPSQQLLKQRYDSISDKREFLAWAWAQFPPLLDRYFVNQFGNGGGLAQHWLTAREEWTRSSAVWSMAGHIVGLGDRHGENVLVDTTSGRCVHVDFAMLFEKGRKLRVPEVVPFRLTQNMVCVMGVAGYEGLFRGVCERMMEVVRANADALLSRLESFLYDPLADWGNSQTHGAKAGVVATREAWLARATVKAKLTGMVDKSGLALSIEGQVQRLIREATSIDNLSKMYIWWGAWI